MFLEEFDAQITCDQMICFLYEWPFCVRKLFERNTRAFRTLLFLFISKDSKFRICISILFSCAND